MTRTVRPELTAADGAGQDGGRHWSACHMSQEERTRIWTEEIAPKL